MLEVAAEALALSLACWAGWKSIYRRPDYNWKGLFLRALGHELELERHEDHPAPLLTWGELAGERFHEYLQRRFAHVILFDFDSGMAEQLASHASIRWYTNPTDEQEIAERVQKKSDRLLFVAKRSQAMPVLRMLHKYPGMRDQLFAVVLIDPQLDEAWVTENFTQEAMDAEANHAIPYILLAEGTQPFQPLIEPPTPATGWRSIEIIDIREISAQHANEKLSQALWVLLAKL